MFDPETIALIQRAPELEGLDLAALPQVCEIACNVAPVRGAYRVEG